MKINQYCSVCKKHLDMEVIPTDDGGDDGVIWLRCPDCQGFLPKFTGEGLKPEKPADPAPTTNAAAQSPPPVAPVEVAEAALEPSVDLDADDEDADAEETGPPPEPLSEYAALLAAADTTTARPYRPSSSYDVGEVILHLAYDDVGIVVAKEALPGGRKALKVFFDGAGLVHLIEQATDGH